MTLLARVSYLLQASYDLKSFDFGWIRKAAVKGGIYSVAIFSIVESSLEGRNLSYQQVIHKAKMPTGVNLPIVLWSDIMRKKDFLVV